MLEQVVLPSSVMLGNAKESLTALPFAMLFAGEPAYSTLPKYALAEELRYNPEFQINDETRLNMTMAGQTSTSTRKSTGTGFLNQTDYDDDSVADESY
jgi:hypothetical protein